MISKSIAIIDHVGCKAGMDSYSGSLANGFLQNGVRCFLFSNFKEEGAENFLFFRKKKGSKFSSVLNQILPFWKAGRICKKENIHECIIHIFSYEIKDVFALRILRFWGLKIIAIVHDVEHLADKENTYRKKILERYCDQIMVHNTFSKKALLQAQATLAKKVKVIPHMNFHNLPSSISKEKAREQWDMSNNKYLLFFGQIKDAKGLDVLLEAMQHVSEDVHLIIAGRVWQTTFDTYQQKIEDFQVQHRVTTHIRFVTDEERDELFTACDAIVLPYKKIYQSGVMQVAMSYKIPIIASDIPPFKEMLGENEFGYLFESEKSNVLADRITYFAEHASEAIEKTKKAYDLAATRFSEKYIANEIINW